MKKLKAIWYFIIYGIPKIWQERKTHNIKHSCYTAWVAANLFVVLPKGKGKKRTK